MILGLDMGGTHIDAIIIKDNIIVKKVKNKTDFENLYQSIWATIKELIKDEDVNQIKRINLSTTVSTNAIVENKISNVGMIIQSGPGLPNDHLNVSDNTIFIKGYTDHRGEVVSKYEDKEIDYAIKEFKKNKVDHVGIVSKFSTRNPYSEIEIGKSLEKDFNEITLGHKMSGKLNFPRRVNTTYLNSAVSSTFNDFANNIKKSLLKEGIKAPVSVLKADGGVMSLDASKQMPVETILSGPAASLMGMNALLETKEDAILLDIGGTTTDIFFLADGVPLFEPQGVEINEKKTLVRSILSSSIGVGGDSEVTVYNDKIKIGPLRKGAPYALGGPVPTPTDAMIVLDKLKIGNKNLALKGVKLIGDKLNMNQTEVSKAILEEMANIIKLKTDELLKTINSKPVYTVKELLEDKRLNPKRVNVIGGPSLMLAPILEDKFKLNTYYPEQYEVANAIGAALAKTTTEINMHVDTSRRTLSVPELGIYRIIDRSYDLFAARDEAIKLLEEAAVSIGANKNELELEIIEESIFNMVDGFRTKGQNIRIRAQVKPGLTNIRIGDKNA